jgi:hypothetical protein
MPPKHSPHSGAMTGSGAAASCAGVRVTGPHTAPKAAPETLQTGDVLPHHHLYC